VKIWELEPETIALNQCGIVILSAKLEADAG
jgi:hypothetical protein